MRSPSHDLLVLALREEPDLLAALYVRLTGKRIAAGLRSDDSVVRFARTAEVRPDLLLRGRGRRWILVEVQQRIDVAKRRRWALAASILFDQRRTMGDLVVVTTSRAVARWAKTAVTARGALGTRFVLQPVVLLVDRRRIDLLLDEARPELALFAVWAVRSGRSARARAVLARALKVTGRLTRRLRDSQVRAILDMVGEPMGAFLEYLAKHPEIFPPNRRFRRIQAALEARDRAALEARGRAQALLTLCAARSLRLSAEERRLVLSCSDLRTLDRWIQLAAVAGSSDRFVMVEPRNHRARVRAKRRRRPTSRQ